MFTIRTIVNDALREINVGEPGDSPDDEDSDDALGRLNTMVSSWPLDNLKLTLPPDVNGDEADYVHVNFELTDTWPLDDGHVEGVTAMLACKIAKRYGAVIDPDTKETATRGWGRLFEAYYCEPVIEADGPLRRTGYSKYYDGVY